VSKEHRRTIRVKLLMAIAGVTTGACLLFGFATSLQLRDVTLDQAKRSLLSLAQVTAHEAAAGLELDAPIAVRKSLSGLFGIGDVRFALVVRPDGGEFVSMGAPPPRHTSVGSEGSPG